MSSTRVTVFTSTNEGNVNTLVGILKSYKIKSEVKKINNSFHITVSEKAKAGAEAIIAKHVRKPGEKKEPHLLLLDFLKENKVTGGLLILTLVTFCLSSFGQDLNRLSKFFMSDVVYHRSIVDNNLVEKAVYMQSIEEIKSGQIWRLFTNVFIHKNLIHLLINLLLIYQFGKIIERTSGLSYILILSLVSLPLCSYMQYSMTKSPLFGGMNALVLTFYGFIVMRSIYDTRYFGKIQQGSFFFMGAWLATGFLNIFHINTSYGAISGLILGLLWGFLSAKLLPEERLIPRKEQVL